MWVRDLQLRNIPPYEEYATDPIRFCRRFNLIRGANGVGKTTVLEALGLLGHLILFRSTRAPKALIETASVVMTLELEATDFSAAELVLAHFNEIVDPQSKYWNEFNGQSTLDRVSSAVQELRQNPRIRIGLNVILTSAEGRRDLKQILSDEALLERQIELRVVDDSHALLLRFLSGASRPEAMSYANDGPNGADRRKPTDWFVSPRRRLQEMARLADQTPPPLGFVGYFHTDMYRWGLGNDIRESPKELNHPSLPLMILNRFRMFPLGDHQEQALNFAQIQMVWDEIISPEGTKGLASIQVQHDLDPPRIVVKISSESPNMISSGENQALFLCLWTLGNDARDSCLLIDEPEIHLAPGAAHRAIQYLAAFSSSMDSQIICATHAPVIPEGCRSDGDRTAKLIFLEGPDKSAVYGQDAIDKISLDLQSTIDNIVNALRRPSGSKIHPAPSAE